MSKYDLLNVEDDLSHVSNLLMAIRMMADSASICKFEGAAISEVAGVALSSLAVTQGRMEKMRQEEPAYKPMSR